MQRDILEIYPSAELQVYAVWLPMLAGDSRLTWDSRVLTDPRVAQFWDEELRVGQWFAERVDGYSGVAWDVYYLYGPEATWDTEPSPLISSGGTIYGERHALQASLLPLLAP